MSAKHEGFCGFRVWETEYGLSPASFIAAVAATMLATAAELYFDEAVLRQ